MLTNYILTVVIFFPRLFQVPAHSPQAPLPAARLAAQVHEPFVRAHMSHDGFTQQA